MTTAVKEPMTTLRVVTISTWTIAGILWLGVGTVWIMDQFRSNEPTELEQLMKETSTEVSNMTTASAKAVTLIDPAGKNLTEVTAQIKETKTLLKVLEGKQEELQQNVTLRVGQVWMKERGDDNNPFDKQADIHFEITSLKDGYVEYKFILTDRDSFVMDSSTIKEFVNYYAKSLLSE